MTSTTTLTLVDGTQIVVPDSIDLITPYVLQEQQDWFEDEIKFLRSLLKPGQAIIDIGANYGAYTLSMAKTVGSTGKIWAFEPASSTAAYLAEGIKANSFTHINLEKSALSKTKGTAEFFLSENSELNTLTRCAETTAGSEIVSVVTLDDRMEAYDWKDIDFVKIDAEGEEKNILAGGKRFFATLSPLIQYEIKAGNEIHLNLVNAFETLGYASYRLVPGLDLLIPFNPDLAPDGFLLNLFCCKPDRAVRLAKQGFLLDAAAQLSNAEKIANYSTYDWHNALAKLPYGRQLSDIWEETTRAGDSTENIAALAYYARSRDSSLSPAERFQALENSLNRFKSLCAHQPAHLRLASMARAAKDYGARSTAVTALSQLTEIIFQYDQIDLSEPFLLPDESFDSKSPGESLPHWVLSTILEELERLAHYSSFYTGISAQPRLELIRDLGFGSAEMQRRLNLLYRRFGLTPSH